MADSVMCKCGRNRPYYFQGRMYATCLECQTERANKVFANRAARARRFKAKMDALAFSEGRLFCDIYGHSFNEYGACSDCGEAAGGSSK